MGFDVCGDFGLNIFNSTAADLIPRPILSFELTVSEANRVNSRDTGIIVYGKLPLMLTRNCPVKTRSAVKMRQKRIFERQKRQDFSGGLLAVSVC